MLPLLLINPEVSSRRGQAVTQDAQLESHVQRWTNAGLIDAQEPADAQ